MDSKKRCAWSDGSDIYKAYHDDEWGKPEHDDRRLFEMLTLEAFQAGLSWITILKKREGFRRAFDRFDPTKMAAYDDKKIEELLQNEQIIRHRGKITAAIHNARLFLEIQQKYGSFDNMIWSYVNHTPIIGYRKTVHDIPARTDISDKISKDLKKMGFKFLGSTTVYAFMQAAGLVNDHTQDCFLYPEDKRSLSKGRRFPFKENKKCNENEEKTDFEKEL